MKSCIRNTSLLMLHIVIVRSFSTRFWRPLGRNGRASRGSLVTRHLNSDEIDPSLKNIQVDNKLEDYQNKNNIRDQVFSAISADGSVKVTACTARNLLNDLMIAHTMTAVPADALGRTVVCALLMSNGMQAEQTCQLTLNGKQLVWMNLIDFDINLKTFFVHLCDCVIQEMGQYAEL